VGPDSSTSGGVRARLLGPFEIEGVDLGGLRSRKARTLLKVLAVAEGRPVSVDRLVDCLWGDAPPAKAEREVAVNASRARAAVGTEVVERTDAGYRLRLGWCDLAALAELEVEAQRRVDADDFVAARAGAEAGLALVRGPFLCDEPDPWWADAEQAAVERRIASLRRIAARAALALGALGAASSEAEQLLVTDPLDEEALRILMTAQAAVGRTGSALHAYAEVRKRLAEELGVDASPETEALHMAILQDEPLPGLPEDARHLTLDVAPDVDAHVPTGRAVEMDALVGALDGVDDGVTCVALEGEPGAGKTTLLDSFARYMQGRPVTVLRATCDAIELPLEPIAAALLGHMRMLPPEEVDSVLGPEAEVLAPLLGTSEAPAAGLPGPAATSDALIAMLHDALGRVFDRMAEGWSVALLLDDAHLAGASTREWLRHLRRRWQGISMLVVLARRTGSAVDPDPVEVDRVVSVGPLDLDAATHIAGPERAAELLERSGGNALFLVELASAGSSLDELPASIQAAVLRRSAEVGAEVASVLSAAALLGDDVDLDLLAGVLGRPPLDVLDGLEVGLAHGLLAERESQLVFRHSLVREALAAEVSVARRSLFHREAARILDDRPGADPLLVAFHARKAGEVERAAEALAAASALAAARFDLAEAERLLDEALSLAPTSELLLRRGRVRLARADLDGADEDALAAVAGGGAPALELRAWVARFRHDMESAIRLGTEAADRASDPTTRASSLLAVAFAHRGLGDLTEAEHELDAAIATPGAADLGARGWLGVLRVHQGRPGEALDLLQPEVGAEVEAIHGFWVEHTLQMTIHAYAMTGQVSEALTLLDRFERELERRGSDARYAGVADNYRSWILRGLCDPLGRELAERAIERTVIPEARTQSMLDLADCCLRVGDVDDAVAQLDRVADSLRARWFQNRWRAEARLDLLRARVHLDAGESERAEEHGLVVADTAAARGDRRYSVLGRLVVARARARQGASVDHDAVAADLELAGEVAALEAWSETALLARDLGVDRWRQLAEERVVLLGRGAGVHEAPFLARARSWLGGPSFRAPSQ
jgi:DNA-binding SARP family transcriptional activator/tetratricopeptide (TPR) repeat protein